VPNLAEILQDHPSAVVDDLHSGVTVNDVYECFVADPTGAPINGGTISVPQALALLPLKGTAHSIHTAAVCTTRYVINRVAPWSIIMGVRYRSRGLYTGGPRRATRSFTQRQYIGVPVWSSFTSDGQTWYQEDRPLEYPRPVVIRVETRWLAGNDVNSVQDALAANAGKYYTIPSTGGRVYRLSDQCNVIYDGISRTRVDYAFEYPCDMPAMSGAQIGSAIPIPALPAHYEYRSALNAAFVPVVTSVPPPAVNGGSLPGFP
jgi:hypothetical protein